MKRSDLETGETSTNMVLRSLLRPARYFDPPDACVIPDSCYICGEEGHTTSNCPNPTEPPRKPCFICAGFEHVAKQCPMGNRDKDCPEDASTETDISCLRCGGFGHDMDLCNYKYSEDDLKDIQCYVCKSYGHLCCVETCDSSWAKSCYRCGKLGHTGLRCRRKRNSSSDIGRTEIAERKRRRLEKVVARALATSAAIRAQLEEKKRRKLEEQERLDEQGDESAEQNV